MTVGFFVFFAFAIDVAPYAGLSYRGLFQFDVEWRDRRQARRNAVPVLVVEALAFDVADLRKDIRSASLRVLPGAEIAHFDGRFSCAFLFRHVILLFCPGPVVRRRYFTSFRWIPVAALWNRFEDDLSTVFVMTMPPLGSLLALRSATFTAGFLPLFFDFGMIDSFRFTCE
ncbi:MAG: hypothetical protein ACXVH7_10295 [Thermoanaerobaculia bacterium]